MAHGVPLGGIDHVDLAVRELATARELYDALLPALGFADVRESPDGIEYRERSPSATARGFFRVREDREHVANGTRIAFAAATPSDVDRFAAIARDCAAARAVEGPEIAHGADPYYAVFFEDASGNKLEVCYRRTHVEPFEAAVDPDDLTPPADATPRAFETPSSDAI